MPTETDQPNQDELGQLLGNLPLEECTLRTTEFYGERGWLAPPGFAFRMTGEFLAWEDGTNPLIYGGSPPEESLELLAKKETDVFGTCLDECSGNRRLALDLLMKRTRDGKASVRNREELHCFIGPWLVIPNRVVDMLFHYDSRIKTLPKKAVSIKVKGPVQSYRDQMVRYIDDLAPDSDTISSVLFDVETSEIAWSQQYAEGLVGSCQVDFVRSRRRWDRKTTSGDLKRRVSSADNVGLPMQADTRPRDGRKDYVLIPNQNQVSEILGEAPADEVSNGRRTNFVWRPEEREIVKFSRPIKRS